MELVEYAQEFVHIARKYVHEYPAIKASIFTSRQSIAIASLGIARILRQKRALSFENLISLSITTSPPEAQKYAEYIAFKVLYGDEVEEEILDNIVTTEYEEIDDVDNSLTASKLLLSDILNFLNLEQSVSIKKDQTVIDFISSLEKDLFSKKIVEDDKTLLENARRRVAFEIVGGRNGIVTHNINSWDTLFSVAKHILIQRIPNITDVDLVYGQLLGYSDEIASMTFERFIEIIANLLLASQLRDKNELDGEFDEIFSSFTQSQRSDGYSVMITYRQLLIRLSVSEIYYAPLLDYIISIFEDEIRDNAKIFDDFIEYPGIFSEHKFDREQLEEIIDRTKELYEENMLDLLDKSSEFDVQFNTNTSEQIADKYHEEFDLIPLEDLMEQPIETAEWMNIFEKAIQERNDVTDDFSNLDKFMDSLSELSEEINNPYMNEFTSDQINKVLSAMADRSESIEDLEQVVDRARELSAKVPVTNIKKKGKQLGLKSNEIARLLGSLFEYFKETILSEEVSYERADNILKKMRNTTSQFNELVQLAIDEQQEGVLGALAGRDLMSVADQIPNTDKGKELFEKALGIGDGENLLQQWFLSGKQLPKSMRQIVKDAAKRVMIDLAKLKSASLIGSSEAGPLPEGSIRPYILGDDLDTIDIDESLDNILNLGKRIDDIETGDFIVRKTVSGRRCVIFLIDISGSMSGAPLASASLATAMLLMAFSRDELAVALFESNTHVLCEINQAIEIDEVVDEILELTARGGTMMQAAISWAEKQFLQSKSEDKMFIMVTDAMIGDFERSKVHLRGIAEMGATSVLIMPHSAYGLGNIQNVLEETNTQLITISDWKAFPETVSEVLSRV